MPIQHDLFPRQTKSVVSQGDISDADATREAEGIQEQLTAFLKTVGLLR